MEWSYWYTETLVWVSHTILGRKISQGQEGGEGGKGGGNVFSTT